MMQSFNDNRDHDYTRHGPCNGNDGYHECHGSYMPKEKMMKMMMMKMMNSHDSHDSMDGYTRKMDYMNMDDMDMESMFSKMFKNMKSSRRASPRSDDYSPMMKRFMGGYQKREADGGSRERDEQHDLRPPGDERPRHPQQDRRSR